MRIRTAFIAALTIAATFVPQAAPAATVRRTVDIRPQSAVHQGGFLYGFSPLFGRLRFTDDGTTLTITGKASGFDPNLPFVTLLYATPSSRVGALACIPPTPNPYSPAQMFTAYWQGTGYTRTLYVQKTGAAYVSLASIATASIRYDSTPQVGNPAATTQTPARYWLQVCANI
jgi:hypothetical protein